MRRSHGFVAFSLVASLSLPGISHAAECVRVIGTESSLPNITLDPALQVTTDDSLGVAAIFNKLVKLSDDGLQPVPDLAESWSVSDDGKTWTFKLRPGIKFSDGKPLSAKDVAYSFKRIIDPAVGSSAANTLSFLKAENIKAIDDLTVEFKTENVVAELPTFFGIKQAYVVQDGAKSEDLRVKPIGTGPFTVETFSPTETRRVLRKNSNYWKPGLPKAECLEISIMLEEVTRTAAIQSGQADLMLSIGASSAPILKADPNIEVMLAPPASYLTIAMWSDTKPFDDVRVRQAVKKAIDRQVLVDTVMLGMAVPGNDSPIPPSWPSAYSPNAPKQDIEGAKKLLAEAGHPNGIDIELNTAESGGMLGLAQAVQQMTAPAGIRIQLVNNPGDTYWDTVWLKRPFFTSTWQSRPPGEALSYLFSSNAKYNEGRWKNPEFDALIASARTELDDAKRVELYKKAQTLLAEQGSVIVPFFYQSVYAMRKACDGFSPPLQVISPNFETVTCSDR
ncbi:peptide/nickel transport system substrate-binding protein [Rhodoligotrophos appendicifer]|uniref:ABC transporter substrate-binding protein n=1 Tax=Rhodoligotrophos appendicifer TaxID=987056 RepID=UPI0014786970|nr:ABC transporter substrate-binding protein [Rhodoligotrophos appendicifer]